MTIQNFSNNSNILNIVLTELSNYNNIELLIIDRYSVSYQISGNFEQTLKGTKQKFRFYIKKNSLTVKPF